MRGFPLHGALAGAALVGRGRIEGRLIDLGAYPAALPGAGSVWGEVYRIADPARWAVLDSAEGPQYDRGEIAVRLTDGRVLTACVYWYRGPTDRGVPIPGGDYRAHAPAVNLHRIPRAEETSDGA